MDNKYADIYREGKCVDNLTDEELISLGKLLAHSMVNWGTSEWYESWEWDTEELPSFVYTAEKLGLIRKRKFHTVTVEKVVYDED